jgi:3-dehydroquinate synthase
MYHGGLDVQVLSFPLEEKNKNYQSVIKIHAECARLAFDRTSSLIALGGGVIGDVTGFAAATYLRGINFFQVPTTLLAQVDSSVGGKTGINIPEGKNLVGAFYQPKAVFIDPSTLRSLPERELRGGLAEVIKYGVIYDERLFDTLARLSEELGGTQLSFSDKTLSDIIARCCTIKALIVGKDEREQGLRAILNFGHTIGHALESATAHEYSHGEAVALGMLTASYIAEDLKKITPQFTERLINVLQNFGLPVCIKKMPVQNILQFMLRDKKVQNGVMRFVLPLRFGKVGIFDTIPQKTIVKALKRAQKQKGQ